MSRSDPVTVKWPLWRTAFFRLPWFLVLGLMALKKPREMRMWTLLIPIVVYEALAFGVERVFGLRGTSGDLMDMNLFQRSLCVGLSCLWLLSYTLEHVGKISRCVRAFIILWVSAWLAACFFGDFQATYLVLGGIVGFMAGLAVVLAFAGAAWACRGRGGLGRFMAWHLVAMCVVGLVVAYPFDSVAGGAISYFGGMLGWQGDVVGVTRLMFAGIMGLCIGLGIDLVLLPFLVYSAVHRPFRSRFEKILGIARNDREWTRMDANES